MCDGRRRENGRGAGGHQPSYMSLETADANTGGIEGEGEGGGDIQDEADVGWSIMCLPQFYPLLHHLT